MVPFLFFVLLKAITWPVFMFLWHTTLDFYSKLWFWGIAILVKLRDFDPILTILSAIKCKSGIFWIFSLFSHGITWENTLKSENITRTCVEDLGVNIPYQSENDRAKHSLLCSPEMTGWGSYRVLSTLTHWNRLRKNVFSHWYILHFPHFDDFLYHNGVV